MLTFESSRRGKKNGSTLPAARIPRHVPQVAARGEKSPLNGPGSDLRPYTGGHSNQTNPPKNMYSPILTRHIWVMISLFPPAAHTRERERQGEDSKWDEKYMKINCYASAMAVTISRHPVLTACWYNLPCCCATQNPCVLVS